MSKQEFSSRQKDSKLPLINPNAAGIDIGADRHWVSVPVGRDRENVRSFACFTADLYAMADWLKQCQIETVAMESTGVYWIPVFQILESRGFEVKLVNAHYVKTVPGHKTDVLDCQWLQQLHTYGLLAGSFRPADQICVLRSYIRQRDNLIKSACVHVQRIQKALTQIDGFGALTVLILLSELGLDSSRFPTVKHFTSWLGLCPGSRVTGGKVKSSKTRLVANRAANAFRMAAQTLCRSHSALGAYYRRMQARLGAPKAITAAAHKASPYFLPPLDIWRCLH
jgi:transposase